MDVNLTSRQLVRKFLVENGLFFNRRSIRKAPIKSRNLKFWEFKDKKRKYLINQFGDLVQA